MIPNIQIIGLVFLGGLLFGGVGTWRVTSWYESSKQVKQQTTDYKSLEKLYADYRDSAQATINGYVGDVQKLTDRNTALQQEQQRIKDQGQADFVALQGKVNGLQTALAKLKSTACVLDDEHQQLLDRFSETANAYSSRNPETRAANSIATDPPRRGITLPQPTQRERR